MQPRRHSSRRYNCAKGKDLPTLTYNEADVFHKLYERIKSAVPQFNDLQDDLRSARVVLDAIGQFRLLGESSGHILSPKDQANLCILVDACKRVLLQVQKTLDDNAKLSSENPSMISRLKWSQRSVAHDSQNTLSHAQSFRIYNSHDVSFLLRLGGILYIE